MPHLLLRFLSLFSFRKADSFALGSYSYAKLGVKGNKTTTEDYDRLAEPEGRVFFAGEHTSSDYRACVHGAYLSGLREAAKVLEIPIIMRLMMSSYGTHDMSVV